ncbi:MAG: S-ribosylhomocysteine lyase [Acholeplasmatales bacterium]|nr:S-ribosylhomocysteine lyase [Acholeplasmatales bacterium]
MDLIESFSIDHRYIIPGIFESRVDTIGDNSKITTYDIRLKRPNVEPAIDVLGMHSLEHIIATYLRNNPEWKNEIIYWGPMGCLTGFYLILKGNRKPEEIYNLILDAFIEVERYTEVPGATEPNCGNYLLHNLSMAKWYAREFVDYLKKNKDNKLIFEYPKTKRLVTNDGNNFFDS